MLFRSTNDGEWSIPKGHVHVNETPVKGAVRELAEETKIYIPESELELVSFGMRTKSDGTFQTKAPGLASTTHDDILEFNTSALSNSNAPTISAYSPTTLNNSLSPTISAYNRGTVLNRFNQGSIFALGPAASGPSMDVGLAATDYRARTAGNRETKS